MMHRCRSALLLVALLSPVIGFRTADALVPQRFLGPPAPLNYTITSFTKVINSGRFKNEDLAQLYWERGVQYGQLGYFDKAIIDYSQALQLRPAQTTAWLNRAVAYARLEKYDEAYADLERVSQLDPAHPSLYNTRGTLSFLLGRYPDAIRDFKHYLSLRPADLYRMLWLYLSEKHLNPNAPGEFGRYVAGVNLDVWPGAMLRLFQGQVGVENVLQSLSKNLGGWDAGSRCEAYFYLGQYYLLQHDNSKALQFFREAVKTGATGYTEYEFSLVYADKLAQ